MFKTNLNYVFLTIALLLTNYVIKAQQIYIETGFEDAYFKDYVNNKGENTLDLSYSKSYQPFLATGYRFNLYKKRFKGDVGFSYNKYKINTGFYAGNVSIPVTYDLSYLTLKAGINLSIINQKKIKLQLQSHISYDFLVSGTSRYKDVVNNLYKENTFDRTLLRYHRGVSGEFLFSKKISIFLSYNVADSFKDKNEDSNIEEKYSLHTHSFSLGLLFNIQKMKKKENIPQIKKEK